MIDKLSKEIEQKKAELAELEAELTAYNDLPEEYRLADRLHTLLCHWSHSDECSWHYGDWYRIPLDSARANYLDKARNLIAAAKKRGIKTSTMLEIFTDLQSL